MTVTAFVAPPFSGLDTLPSLGVVVLSLGFLMEDAVLAGIGLVIGVLGAVVVIGLGSLVLRWVRQLSSDLSRQFARHLPGVWTRLTAPAGIADAQASTHHRAAATARSDGLYGPYRSGSPRTRTCCTSRRP